MTPYEVTATEVPESTPYKYQGLPLTPNVISELARELLKAARGRCGGERHFLG
jgi:hypothetical protein